MKKSSRVRKDLEFGILVESYVDNRSQNVCSFFRFCNSSRHVNVNGDASGIAPKQLFASVAGQWLDAVGKELAIK